MIIIIVTNNIMLAHALNDDKKIHARKRNSYLKFTTQVTNKKK